MFSMRRIRLAAVALVLLVDGFALVSPALGAQKKPQAPVVARLTFHLVAPAPAASLAWFEQVQTIGSSGPYVLLSPQDDPDTGTLINDRTGAETLLSPISQRVCDGPPTNGTVAPGSLGESLVVFTCRGSTPVPAEFLGSTPKVYSIQTGNWTTVNYAAESSAWCGPLNSCLLYPSQAGANWLAYIGNDECEAHCYPLPPPPFQNVYTSQLASPHTNASTLVDLDSPSLTRRICRPLNYPSSLLAAAYGDVSYDSVFYGRFGVFRGPHATTYLQRCGSKSHMRLPETPEAGNSTSLLWQNYQDAPRNGYPRSLAGVFLPSEKPFQIPVPISFRKIGLELTVLSQHTLYVETNHGDVWAAPAPRQPRRPNK